MHEAGQDFYPGAQSQPSHVLIWSRAANVHRGNLQCVCGLLQDPIMPFHLLVATQFRISWRSPYGDATHGRAVAALQFDRQAVQLVEPRAQPPQVEPLHRNHTLWVQAQVRRASDLSTARRHAACSQEPGWRVRVSQHSDSGPA